MKILIIAFILYDLGLFYSACFIIEKMVGQVPFWWGFPTLVILLGAIIVLGGLPWVLYETN